MTLPQIFFHNCNFDTCHQIQLYRYKYQWMKIRVSWVGGSLLTDLCLSFTRYLYIHLSPGSPPNAFCQEPFIHKLCKHGKLLSAMLNVDSGDLGESVNTHNCWESSASCRVGCARFWKHGSLKKELYDKTFDICQMKKCNLQLFAHQTYLQCDSVNMYVKLCNRPSFWFFSILDLFSHGIQSGLSCIQGKVFRWNFCFVLFSLSQLGEFNPDGMFCFVCCFRLTCPRHNLGNSIQWKRERERVKIFNWAGKCFNPMLTICNFLKLALPCKVTLERVVTSF